MEYNICSPNVPPTCTNQVGQRDPCRPGCACPDGMVLRERDGQCVEPFLCEGEAFNFIHYCMYVLYVQSQCRVSLVKARTLGVVHMYI